MDGTISTAGQGGDALALSISADTRGLQTSLADATRYGRQFSATLISAFDGLTVKGKSFNNVLGSVALGLSRLVLSAALRPLEGQLNDAISGTLGALGDGATTAFASGAMLVAGTPTPFASGGVVSSPLTFPLGDGRTGLAGERGAEAILPLARGSDGRLGVAASGMGGARTIVFNVTTADADSFRRSETQIAAMVTRAAGLGNRNL